MTFEFSVKLTGDAKSLTAAVQTAREQTKQLNDALKSTQDQAQRVDLARAILGTRGQGEIANELLTITRAYQTLKTSGVATTQELARATENYQQSMKKLNAELNNTKEATKSAGQSGGFLASGIGSATAALGAFLTIQSAISGAKAFLRIADEMTLLNARIKLVSSSQAEFINNQQAVFDQAIRLRAPLEDVGRSFTRIAAATKELGGSAQEAQKLNEILLITAKISGSTGAEASAAAIQFAQALGSGVLQGDELKSILENNQELARQLAKGLGVSVSELRKLGEEGKLTADKVAGALLKQLPVIQQKVGEIPATTADKMQVLNNELSIFIGKMNESTGASKLFGNVLDGLATQIKGISEKGGLNALALALTTGQSAPLTVLGLNSKRRESAQAAEFRREENRANIGGRVSGEESSLGIAASARRELEAFAKVVDDFESPKQKLIDSLKKFGTQLNKTQESLANQRKDLIRKGADTTDIDEQIRKLESQRVQALKEFSTKFHDLDEAELNKRKASSQKAIDIQQERDQLLFQQQTIAFSREKALAESRVKELEGLEAAGLISKGQLLEEKARLIELEVGLEEKRLALRRETIQKQILIEQDEKQSLKLRQDLLKLSEQEDALDEKRAQAQRVRAEGIAAENAERERMTEVITSSTDAMRDELEQVRQQNKEFGLTKTQIQQLRLAEIQLRITRLEGIAAGRTLTEDERVRLAVLKDQLEVQRLIIAEVRTGELKQSGADFVSTLDQGFTQVFRQFSTKGKDAFTVLKDSFKSIFMDFVLQFAARPIFLNLIAQMSGGMGMGNVQGAALQALSQNQQGNGGGNLGSIMNLFGGGGSGTAGLAANGATAIGSVFGAEAGFGALGAGSAQAAMLAAQTAEFGAAGISATSAGLATAGGTAGAGVLGGALSMVAAAIPWIAAAIAIYSIFAKPGGGPKSGGSFNAMFDQDGNPTNMAVPGSDNGRFFTPNQSDSGLKDTVVGLNKDIRSTITALGGKASQFSVGLGFDTDPQGTAENRISSQLRDSSGKLLFSSQDRGVGRDEKQLQSELTLEARRILLSAIQSDSGSFAKPVAEALNSVVAATASEEDIDKILKLATNVKSIIDVLSKGGPFLEKFADQALVFAKLPEAARKGVESLFGLLALEPFKVASEQLKQQNASLFEKFNQTKVPLRELITAFDGSVDSSNRLVQAAQQRAEIEVALASQIIQITEELTGVGGVFAQTIRGFNLQVLDDEGKFNFLKSETDNASKDLLTAKDPEEIRRLGNLINSNIQQQFNLLDPEEQKRRVKEFTDFVEQVNKLVKERLGVAQDDLNKERDGSATSIQAAIEKALDAIAKQNQAAADTQTAAANTQLAAANTPQQVVVTVRGAGSYEVGPDLTGGGRLNEAAG